MTPARLAVLCYLTQAAEGDLPCPTNEALAHFAGISKEGARKSMSWLRAHGYIRIDRAKIFTVADRSSSRIVTIVTSGKRTRSTKPTGKWDVTMVLPPKPKPEVQVLESFIKPPSRARLMAGR